MTKSKKISILLMLSLAPILNYSQQLPQFTQYMYNTISINPAYAGTRERLNITILNRNQWLGVNGAPITQTLSVDSRIPNTNLGIGLSIIHDKLGYEQTSFIYSDLSYTVNIAQDYWLSFGLKLGLSKYGIDPDLLIDPDAIGDQYLNKIFNKWKPNFGAGIYLRSDHLFISFSSPRILSYINSTDIEFINIDQSSYYLIGGYLLELNPQLSFKPTFLIKYTNGAPLSVDLTGNFILNEKLSLGLAYRLGDALGALVSLDATDNLKIGYAYEFNTTAISPYTSGSHELFLSYEFGLPKSKCDCENQF